MCSYLEIKSKAIHELSDDDLVSLIMMHIHVGADKKLVGITKEQSYSYIAFFVN